MTGVRVWLATAPGMAEARRLADALVGEEIAACVNIVPKATSVYRWQSNVETAEECLLVIKSAATAADRLKSRYKGLHPYDVPELIALDVPDGLPDYLAWVLGAT